MQVAERWSFGAGSVGVRAAPGERGQELRPTGHLRAPLGAGAAQLPGGVDSPALGDALGKEDVDLFGADDQGAGWKRRQPWQRWVWEPTWCDSCLIPVIVIVPVLHQ